MSEDNHNNGDRYRRSRGRVNKSVPAFDPTPSARFAHRALAGANVPGALIGRLAVWAWLPDESDHEFTKDLDVAVTQADMALVRSWVDRQGLSTRALTIGGVNVRHPGSGVNVDFIDRSAGLGGLFSEAVANAIQSGELTRVGEIDLPLVAPEYLVTMKLATGEDKDERDAERLLRVVEDLDLEHVRRLCEAHLGIAGRNRLEVLLRSMGHPEARPKRRYDA